MSPLEKATAPHPPDRLLVFTKPARPGRVKTRLIGDLSAQQAAELHRAFLGDLVESLGRDGRFELVVAWGLGEEDEDGEAGDGEALASRLRREVPDLEAGSSAGSLRQQGKDLGERLFRALHAVLDTAPEERPYVAVVGSDHPTLAPDRVAEAFRLLEAGACLVLGPALDGGYYLLAVSSAGLHPKLFDGLAWSTPTVFQETLERARQLGIPTSQLPEAADVDTPEDLRRLAEELAARDDETFCPRTRRLLAAWDRLPQVPNAVTLES